MLTVGIFLLLIAGFFHPISAITQDLGRHLLTGEIIFKTKSIPTTNLFSYTNPDFPFINHHWFSEVIFFSVNQLLGFNGLLMLTVLIVTIAFGLVFFFSRKKGTIIAITIVSILYLRVLFERTDIRPEIFSFLFLSIFIVVLYRYRQRYTKLIFLLPLIELLWVNTHIYFPIGIATAGLFFLDELIIHRKNIFTKHTSILVGILLFSSLLTILNPHGIKGALYPFSVLQNYGYTIEENQHVFFLWNYFGGKTTILFFFISAAGLFLTLLLTIKKNQPIDWFLGLFFTYLAISAERNFPLFVFGTFIPFARSLSVIFDKLPVKTYISRYIVLILLGIILLNIIEVGKAKGVGFGIEVGAKNGVDFFLKNNLTGHIFNNFDIGSYLEYRLYPQEKVFIDGRPEAYPASFIQHVYIPMQTDKNIFDEMVKKYNLNTIFFSHTDQTPWAASFFKFIINDTQWKMIYLDDFIVIFAKNNEKNRSVIKTYGMDEQSLRISNFDQHNKNGLYSLVNFFNKIGWKEQEKRLYPYILSLDPNSCLALYNLSVLLSLENNPASQIYLSKFQYACQ